jgi:N,N'-diacetyllegionaminate synthase
MIKTNRTKIIAEIAQGFEGNSYLANLLAKAAVKSGADAVKFQLVFADELCVSSYPYFDFFKSLEMSFDEWLKISDYVGKNNVELYFDIYGPKSLEWSKKLKASGVKISTTDFNNHWLIKESLKLYDSLLLSIGGVEIEELDSLIEMVSYDFNKITFMHGFQAEPTLTKDNNLLRISTLKKKYNDIKIGFMDHSKGTEDESIYLPILALGFGVSCIEKHISLDHILEVEDYISALSPSKFKRMVEIIRGIEKAVGSNDLKPSEKELDYKLRSGKVIVSSKELITGSTIKETDLLLKRVSTEPNKTHLRKFEQLVGRTVIKDFDKDLPFTKDDIL